MSGFFFLNQFTKNVHPRSINTFLNLFRSNIMRNKSAYIISN